MPKTCPYCQTPYQGSTCPFCREERLRSQSTYQPSWEEIMDEEFAEELDRENDELPYFDYDHGLDD